MKKTWKEGPLTEFASGAHGKYLIEKQSWFGKLEESLSNSYASILVARQTNQLIAASLIMISFLQIWAILADDQLSLLISFDSYPQIRSTFLVIRITGISKALQSPNAFFVVAYAGFAVLIIYAVLLYIFCKRKRKLLNSYSFLGIVLNILSYLIYWVFALPMADSIGQIFDCTKMHNNHNITCYDYVHLIHIAIFSLYCVMLLLIGTCIAIFMVDSNPKSADCFARFDWNFEIVFLAARILIAVVINVFPEADYHLVILAILFISSCIFCIYYSYYMPYYNEFISNTFGACVLSLFFIALCKIAKEILERFDILYPGEILSHIVGICLFGFFTRNLRDRIQEKNLFTLKSREIADEVEFNVFMLLLISTFSPKEADYLKRKEHYDILKHGYLLIHRSECTNPNCVLESRKVVYHPIQRVSCDIAASPLDHPISLLHFLGEMYRVRLAPAGGASGSGIQVNEQASITGKQRTRTVDTFLAYAYFLLFKIGHFPLAAVNIAYAELCATSIKNRHLIYMAKRVLELSVNEKNLKKSMGAQKEKNKETDPKIKSRETKSGDEQFEANLDPRKVIVFEEQFQSFGDILSQTVDRHKDFWRELEEEKPDLQSIYDFGRVILDEIGKVSIAWNKLDSLNRHFPKAEYLYGKFLKFVIGLNEEGDSHLLIAKERNTQNQEDNLDLNSINKFLFDKHSAVFVVSAMEETMGKILKVTENVTTIFGYAKPELINRQINVIIPEFYGESHNQFMKNYAASGREKVLNRMFETFGANRNGFVINLKLIVKHYYDLHYGSVFTAIIHLNEKNSEVLVTNSIGQVIGISQGASDDFGGLSPLFLLENPVCFYYFCPDLTVNPNAIEEEYRALTGTRTLTCRIPKNPAALSMALNKGQESHLISPSNIRGSNRKLEPKFMKKLVEQRSKKALLDGGYKTLYQDCEVKTFTFDIINLEYPETGLFLKLLQYYKSRYADSDNDSVIDAKDHKLPIDKEYYDPKRKLRSNTVGAVSKQLHHASLFGKLIRGEERRSVSPESPLLAGKFMKRLFLSKFSDQPQEESKENKDKEEPPQIDLEDKPVIQGLLQPNPEDVDKDRHYDEESPLTRRRKNDAQMYSLAEKEKSDERESRDIAEMRNSSQKNFRPSLVKILRLILSVSTLMVLIIAIILFTLITSTFRNIQEMKTDMKLSRLIGTIEIAENVRELVLMTSQNRFGTEIISNATMSASYNFSSIGFPQNQSLSYYDWKKKYMFSKAKSLLTTQAECLWFNNLIGNRASQLVINPEEMKVEYPNMLSQTTSEPLFIHSAIGLYLDQAFRIYEYNSTAIKEDDNGIAFVLNNGFYIFPKHLAELGTEIQNDINMKYSSTERIAIIVAFVVGAIELATLITLGIILFRMRKQQNKVLKLLFDIKKKRIKYQIDICVKFNRDALWENTSLSDEQEEDGEPKDEESSLLAHNNNNNKETEGKLSEKKAKAQNYKEFIGTFKSSIIKVLAFTLLETGYFLVCYFLPSITFDSLANHLSELVSTKKIITTSYKLYSYAVEMFGTNGTTSYNDKSLDNYIVDLAASQIENIRVYYEAHSEFSGTFSDQYKMQFDQLMENSVCNLTAKENYKECQTLLGGILDKGLIPSAIGYAQYIAEMIRDYQVTSGNQRTISFLQRGLAGQRKIDCEIFNKKYMGPFWLSLLDIMDNSMNDIISSTFFRDSIIFGFFIAYLLIGYYMYLTSLLTNLKNDLFVGHAMLAILPIEIIMQSAKIKKFLLKSHAELTAQTS